MLITFHVYRAYTILSITKLILSTQTCSVCDANTVLHMTNLGYNTWHTVVTVDMTIVKRTTSILHLYLNSV